MVQAPEPKKLSISVEVIDELRSSLSEEATIVLPGDATWRESTIRWTEHQNPEFALVVIPAVEQDIQTTVLFASSHEIPFLATTARHGHYGGFSKIRNGIQIDLRKFNKVEVLEDGNHARIGGGVLSRDVANSLREAGKITVTGVCDMVGLGFWLGGGHGILQGSFGLAADHIVEARVILSDGSIVTVSETSEPDLFWALKGAGYMFGIVTEMKIRVHDFEPYATWCFETYIFSEQQLETVFEALNLMKLDREPTDQYYARFATVPEVDSEKCIVTVAAISKGTHQTTNLTQFTKRLRDIPRLVFETGEFPYETHHKLFDAHEQGLVCKKGPTFMLYPIDLVEHNVESVRQIYHIWDKAMRENPAFVKGGSTMMFESFPCHAVQAIPAESTAFPWRADHLLITPFLIYAPDPSLDETSRRTGRAIQSALRQGSGKAELHTYANYATGEESVRSLYGYEPWRLEKLRAVKAKYDPQNAFGFHGEL